jgi:AmmeMemoRadiSam system protein B
MENKIKIRRASHAGSWYESNRENLNLSLENFLTAPMNLNNPNKTLKAIIAPHAGLEYSGPTAGFAYTNINPKNYSRVFLLGPSHHMYTNSICLPYGDIYETPLGDIEIDQEIISKLKREKYFETLKKNQEEKEHSLEMHLPFIKKIFGENPFKLIPLMIGNINSNQQDYYGKVLSEYIKDQKNLFIISSDFCHWGSNFDFTPTEGSIKNTSNFIEKLDKIGIDLICSHNEKGFSEYLEETQNTICGCYPILVYLYGLKYAGMTNADTELLKYSQSGKISNIKDMSVSYASIVTYI